MKREEFEKYAEENGLVVVSKEQYDKAKKALEQPCEDCVSRKAVLNTLFFKSDNNCEKVQELVTHGTCKDCSIKRLDKEESEEVGVEKYFCLVVGNFVDETPDFYCANFEKRGSEE